MDRKIARPPAGAVLLFLVLGCIFAVEGYLLLQLVLWPFNAQAHWIVVALVSFAFFYLGVVVASLMLMASRHNVKADDHEAVAVTGQKAAQVNALPSPARAEASPRQAARPQLTPQPRTSAPQQMKRKAHLA